MARRTFLCCASGSFMPCSRPDHRSMRVLIAKYTRCDSVSQADARRHQVEIGPCSRKRVWSQHLPFLSLGRVLCHLLSGVLSKHQKASEWSAPSVVKRRILLGFTLRRWRVEKSIPDHFVHHCADHVCVASM